MDILDSLQKALYSTVGDYFGLISEPSTETMRANLVGTTSQPNTAAPLVGADGRPIQGGMVPGYSPISWTLIALVVAVILMLLFFFMKGRK